MSRGVDVIVARGVMGIVSVERVSQLVVLWLQFLVFIASAPYIKAWIWMSVGGLVIAILTSDVVAHDAHPGQVSFVII